MSFFSNYDIEYELYEKYLDLHREMMEDEELEYLYQYQLFEEVSLWVKHTSTMHKG